MDKLLSRIWGFLKENKDGNLLGHQAAKESIELIKLEVMVLRIKIKVEKVLGTNILIAPMKRLGKIIILGEYI